MTRRPFVHAVPGRERNPISLFPFLAVLICTMGTLILLLVVLVRQVRLQVEHRQASQEMPSGLPSPEDLARLREDLTWQQEQIQAARQATQEQLNVARALLGHSEESIRRLRAELAALQDRLHSLEHSDPEANAESLQEQLRAAEQEVAALERQLAERGRPASQTASYAVVPYSGKHGTARRPIYLECRSEAIILQPEGIEFVLSDFLGSLGPGNPLDAALRAAREFLVRSGQIDPVREGDTYPLLLVRPDGIEAFYAARAALTSWGTEFGYELIEADWTLVYPPPQPQLAAAVREAVHTARERQEFLARAAPGRYGRSVPKYRLSPYIGGAVRENDGSDDETASVRRAGGSPGFASLTDMGDDSAGNAAPLGTDIAPSPIAATPHRAVGDPFGGIPDDAADQSIRNAGKPENLGGGQVSGTGNPDAFLAQQRKPAFGVGDGIRNGRPPSGNSAGLSDGRLGRSGSGESNVRPLADSRGAGWAVPDHERGAIPVTRPIRLECYNDRIVLVPEKGLDQIKVFTFEEGLEPAVDRLIEKVHEYMESWGIAGSGMYWRPVLTVRTAPDAGPVFCRLQILLQDSGLEIEPAENR